MYTLDPRPSIYFQRWAHFKGLKGALMHCVRNRSRPLAPSLAFVMIIRTSILPFFHYVHSVTRQKKAHSHSASNLAPSLDNGVINNLVIIALFTSPLSPHAWSAGIGYSASTYGLCAILSQVVSYKLS